MKCEDLSNELETSQRDCRNCSSELFRLRAAWDETVEQLDTVRRENKNLADEIKGEKYDSFVHKRALLKYQS